MRMLRLFLLVLWELALAAAPASATSPAPVAASNPNGGVGVPTHGIYCMDASGNAQVCVFTDANNASYNAQAAPIPMTVGTTYAAGRGLQFICTAAGNVSIETGGYADVIPVPATGSGPPLILPMAVTAINASGTTATCTYLLLN